MGNSEAPHQPYETALNLDAVGSEDPGLIGLVGRLEGDRVTTAAQPLEGDLLIVDQSNDDAAGFRGVTALNDHGVAVEDTGLDHAIAGYFERIMLAAPPEEARRHPDRRALVAQRLDRCTSRNPAIEREIHGLDIVGDRRTRQRAREIAANHGGGKSTAFGGRPGGALLGQFDHFQSPGTVRQPPDEPALLQPADQSMNPGFGSQV